MNQIELCGFLWSDWLEYSMSLIPDQLITDLPLRLPNYRDGWQTHGWFEVVGFSLQIKLIRSEGGSQGEDVPYRTFLLFLSRQILIYRNICML